MVKNSENVSSEDRASSAESTQSTQSTATPIEVDANGLIPAIPQFKEYIGKGAGPGFPPVDRKHPDESVGKHTKSNK